MKHSPPRLGLLFTGGGAIGGPGVLRTGVHTTTELQAWLAEVSELTVMSSLLPELICPDGRPVGIPDWQAAARAIQHDREQCDGFVILHQATTMAVGAVALDLFLPHIDRPVIFVTGGRTNIVNALHVALSDQSGVFVVQGNHVLYGRSCRWAGGQPGGIAGLVAGKIDFGIRFVAARSGRAWRGPAIGIATQPVFLTAVPGVAFPAVPRTVDGVVILVPPDAVLSADECRAWRRAIRPTIPVIIVSPTQAAPNRLPPMTSWLQEADQSAAMVQCLWALGQKPSADWRRWLAHAQSRKDRL